MLLTLFLASAIFQISSGAVPVVVGTWAMSRGATQAAWNVLESSFNAVDALEVGGTYCEAAQCDLTVGYGGSPDETGETTLDAMIMDGEKMDIGAVANLRRIKSAMSVAKHVLQHTQHSMLSGDQATKFAIMMGFKEESLSTNVSTDIWNNWKNSRCQPNYWKNVEPDPMYSCGPYRPISENSVYYKHVRETSRPKLDASLNHDTLGMVIIDMNGKVVAGTTTNGLKHKIPGRVGDSPIPGAGAYADNEVGGACATGDGDVMMRFLPSLLAVEEMRRGKPPQEAAEYAIGRITKRYQTFSGAVIAVNIDGEVGAACNYMSQFPFSVKNCSLHETEIFSVPCSNVPCAAD